MRVISDLGSWYEVNNKDLLSILIALALSRNLFESDHSKSVNVKFGLVIVLRKLEHRAKITTLLREGNISIVIIELKVMTNLGARMRTC